jgi:hypothetical protein
VEQGQEKFVVLAVVAFLGAFALLGLAGTIWLVHDGVDASAVAVVSTLTGAAAGSLGTLLATTRTAPPAALQQAAGYQQAVADVQALAQAPQQP